MKARCVSPPALIGEAIREICFLAKGSIIALSDFFCISHLHSDMLITEFPCPGRFPFYPTAMIFRTGLYNRVRKTASENMNQVYRI